MAVLLLLLFPHLVSAQENCGPTLQTFWQIDIQEKILVLKGKYRHPQEEYCERSMTASPNAQVVILDRSKNILRKFKTFLPMQLFEDRNRHHKSQALYGRVKELVNPVVQIKFSDDQGFKKAKYIVIVFENGNSYGPAEI